MNDEKTDYTSDGVPIVEGLRVVDYNRDHGAVESVSGDMGIPGETTDIWYIIRLDDGDSSYMNGERLMSEANYRKGM